MLRTIVGASLIGFTWCAAFGQAPAFDVASVKASKMTNFEGKGRDNIESSPGSLTMRNVTLGACIQWAYDVKEYQVLGPAWLGNDRYDIVAKMPNPAPDAQMRLMIQTLLADRFKLTLHREKKELQVYALIQGKNPPKLRPSDDNAAGGAKIAGTRVTFSKMSMAQLADLLSKQMDRPVLDMTELPGRYDFTVDTSSAEAGGDGKEMSPMVNAKIMLGRSLLPVVQEQLGLKVEGRKQPADVLIVDHAERVPTEN
jgi:uncharacterized protein (TIGR03435 family)